MTNEIGVISTGINRNNISARYNYGFNNWHFQNHEEMLEIYKLAVGHKKQSLVFKKGVLLSHRVTGKIYRCARDCVKHDNLVAVKTLDSETLGSALSDMLFLIPENMVEVEDAYEDLV